MNLKPLDIIIMGKDVAIKWNDESESFIDAKKLRQECPCAHCSGETDVFGNIYKGSPKGFDDDKKYQIKSYINIGHYAIRIVWADNHNAGIYSFVFLKSLDDSK